MVRLGEPVWLAECLKDHQNVTSCSIRRSVGLGRGLAVAPGGVGKSTPIPIERKKKAHVLVEKPTPRDLEDSDVEYSKPPSLDIYKLHIILL